MRHGKRRGQYEEFIHAIFTAAIQVEGLRNATIEHDVTLPGKTRDANGTPGTHQIDVYWKFDIANVTYQAVVQAKDWSSRVTKEKVLAFKSVLDDLPGQPRGIMVTRVGYQSGAEAFAREHGIELYVLQSIRSDARDVVSKQAGAYFDTAFENVEMLLEPVWAEGNKRFVREFYASTDPAKCWIFTLAGRKVKPLRDAFQNIKNVALATDAQGPILNAFDEPVEIREEDRPFGIRVVGIVASIALSNKRPGDLSVDVSRLFSTIVRQVTGNREFYVDHENRLHEKSQALCDFCGVPVPDDDTNMFEASRVAVVSDAGASQVFEAGPWGGCDPCAELIRAGKREELYQRAKVLMSKMYPESTLMGLDMAHNAFWLGYTGRSR